MEVSLTGEAQKKAQNRVGCYLDPKGSGPLLFMCRRVQPYSYTRLGIEVSSDVSCLYVDSQIGERGASVYLTESTKGRQCSCDNVT
jgi:hypothetical protein